jgi:hypothetical protein
VLFFSIAINNVQNLEYQLSKQTKNILLIVEILQRLSCSFYSIAAKATTDNKRQMYDF